MPRSLCTTSVRLQKAKLFFSILVYIPCFLSQSLPLFAGDGLWSAAVGGSWTNPANWNVAIVADGTNALADFSTQDIPSNATVTLDASVTVGHLKFADVSSGQNWILNPGVAGILTLAVYSNIPSIYITNTTLTIGCSIAGTQGFIKDGPGSLTLTAGNPYSGPTIVSNGILNLSPVSTLGISSNIDVFPNAQIRILVSPSNTIVDNAVINLRSGAGYGQIYLTNAVNETVGALSFDFVEQAAGTWGATSSGASNKNDNFFSGPGILTVLNGPTGGISVINQPASGITSNSATLNGNLVSGGGTNTATVTIYWGLSDGGTNAPSWTNSIFMGTLSPGPFSTNIQSLVSNTQYSYRCYASNVIGTAWAPATMNFITTGGGPAPSVIQDFDTWPGAPLAMGTYTNVGWIIDYSSVMTNTPADHSLPYVCSMFTGGTAFVRSPFMPNGISSVSFLTRNFNTNANYTIDVETSLDGTNWTTRMVVTNTLITWSQKNCQLDEPAGIYVRLRHTTLPGGSLAYIDDINIWDMAMPQMNYFVLSGLPTYSFTNQYMTFTLQAWQGTNLWTNYTGTVSLSTSSGGTIIPSNYTFQASDFGIKTFTNGLVYDVGAHHWLDVEDTTNSSMFVHGSIVVFNSTSVTSATTRLDITGIYDPISTSELVSVSVAAVDMYFNLLTNFFGPVSFTSSDGSASLPFLGSGIYTYTLGENGWHTFTNDLQFNTIGEHWFCATSLDNTNVYGTQYDITVQGDGFGTNVTHLALSDVQRYCNTGETMGIRLEARDVFERVFTNFTGTIIFSSSDPAVVFAGGSNVVLSGADLGQKLLSNFVQFNTPGIHWLSAKWISNTNIHALITNIVVDTAVGPPPVWLEMEVIPGGEIALRNELLSLKVYARTTGGVYYTSYSNTVQFSSSDGSATFPGPYTFMPADQGVHIFTNALRFGTAGKQDVTVEEQGNPSINASSGFMVLPIGATNTTTFKMEFVSTMLSNFWYDLTIVACGDSKVVNTNFNGTITFSSTDPLATFNWSTTAPFTNGIARLSPQITMKTPGPQTIRATYLSDTNVFGEMNVFVLGGGTYYYVNNAYGLDANDGLSTNTPFSSIVKGYSLAGPGDVIIVGGGTADYTNNIIISTSGLPGRWIGLVGDMDGLYFGNGHGPRIRPAQGFGITDVNQSFLAFSGLQVCNCSTGIAIYGGSNIVVIDSEITENINGLSFTAVTNVTLIDNEITFTTNIAIGLDAGCPNTTIKDNTIFNCYSGINILNSTNVVITNNWIENVGADAITLNATSSGEIAGNVIRNIGLTGIAILSPAMNTAWANINHNIISGCGTYAVKISEAAAGVQIVNNTIADNAGGVDINNSANLLLKNNIIANQTSLGVSADTTNGLIAAYNDVFGSITNWAMAASPGVGCISSAPLFAGAGDYHLQSTAGRPTDGGWVNDGATSPCIDAGDPGDNCDKEPLPNGGRIDMGAYGNNEQASRSSGPVMHDIMVIGTINGTISPSGTVWIANGSNTTFSIIPDINYHILDVIIDGTNNIGPTNSYTFINVTNGGHMINATFAIDTYTLNVISAYGTPVPAGLTTNNWNVPISASVDAVVPNGASTQYVSIGWFGGGSVSSLGTSNSISFNITNNSWITWIWRTNYWLNVTPSSYGAVNLTNAWFARGSNIVLTATPSNGYYFSGWTGDIISSTNPINIAMNQAYSLTPNFVQASNSIIVNIGGSGSVNPSGTVSVAYDGNINFSVIADPNNHISRIITNGFDVPGSPFTGITTTFTNFMWMNIITGGTFGVNFAPNSYDVMATAAVNGTISPAGTSWVGHGSNFTYTITPDANYHIVDVTIDITNSIGATNSYTFINVTNGGHSIEATFAVNVGSVCVIISPTNANTLGAQWQMTTGPDTTWHTNGYVITGVPGDQAPYTITFNTVSAFTTPADRTNIVITHSATTTVNVSYLLGSMVLVPGGTFMMGMTASTNGHSVTLSDFYIDVKEVTVGEFQTFCAGTGNTMPAAPAWGWTDTNLPVVNISWNLASAYASWAGKRLVTEAEYEYVMRSGVANQLYPWGNSIGAGDANYFGNVGQPVAGGNYPVSSYGVYDIAGNVWEWCGDWYASALTGPVTNPAGPVSGSTKVCRGGSWASSPFTLQCAPRYNIKPSVGYSDVGFRCAVSVSGGPGKNSSGSVAGVPEWWIQYYFGLDGSFDPNADSDLDGMRDKLEFLAGTDPRNANSLLKVKGMNKPEGTDFTLQWSSTFGKKYIVERASNLIDGFIPVITNLSATPPMNTFTDSFNSGNSYFYRIKVE